MESKEEDKKHDDAGVLDAAYQEIIAQGRCVIQRFPGGDVSNWDLKRRYGRGTAWKSVLNHAHPYPETSAVCFEMISLGADFISRSGV